MRKRQSILIKMLVIVGLLLLSATENIYAQSPETAISGLITDGDGNPLIGVTVTNIQTKQGITSNIDGQYSVKARKGNVLKFQYLGFNEEEIEVRDQTTINVRMTEASTELGEIVVVGYGQQKKESVVSALNTITAKELAVTGRSLTNSIAGQIAGVIAIQPSGEPGYDDSNFWIRGVSSFAGGTSPLIIIDGVPRSKTDMNNIPVDEIETFTVLKDASATSVYGAEGANGVVLITTKRGSSQKTAITFNAEHSVRTPIRLPKQLDSYKTLNLYNEATWNMAGNPLSGWLPTYTDDILEKYKTGEDPDLYPNTNWMELLKEHTQNSRYTINFRGGSERAKFFISGAYYTEDGIYNSNTIENYDANLKYERFNLRSNIDLDITKTTKISVDLSGYFVKQNAPVTSADNMWSIITLAPRHLFPMVYSDGKFAEHPVYSAGSVGTAERANPYNLLNNMGYTKNWTVTVQSRVNLVQDLDVITKGLSWRGAVSFDAYSQSRINRTKEEESFFATGRDPETGELKYNNIRPRSALGNPVSGGTSGERNIYIETALDYKRTFGDHDVTGLVLYNQKERQVQTGGGLDLLPYRKQSIVARATYGYDGRYLLEASMGTTGSENFAEGHRWGVFPSIGAAWWVSHEEFMSGIENTISKLKFRVSYGKTGNDVLSSNLERFPYREKVNEGSSGYNFAWTGGANVSNNGQGSGSPGAGIIESDYATPQLKWEIEDKFNTGIDLGLFNGRIDIGFDYFFNQRHSILMRRNTIPSAAGFRVSPMQNFGKVENSGFDLNLTAMQRVGEVLLSGRLNYTHTNNKVLEYDEIPQIYDYQAYTGQRINQPRMYVADGLYTPDDFIIETNPTTGAQKYTLKPDLPNPGFMVEPGDIKYVDLNNDGKIDTYDETYLNGFYPTNVPGIVYGFGLNAEWKGFNVGIFFQGVGNVSAYLLDKSENFYPFQRSITDAALRVEAMDRWRHEDPYNQDVLFPRLRTSGNGNNTRGSTWWYRDASFLRLKNVEFGYNIPTNIVKKIHLGNIRLYVQGENLHTWDKIKFWDPELRGARSGAKYPLSSTWRFGLDVTF